MPAAPPATKVRPSRAVLARLGALVGLLALAAAPLASLLAGPEAVSVVQAWRALRDAGAAALGFAIRHPFLADALAFALLTLLAAACDGAGRGGAAFTRALAHGWRAVNRVSAPRSGPLRPIVGAGQGPLAVGYFLASAVVGALIVAVGTALLAALVVSTLNPDFNAQEFLVLSGGLWLAFGLLGLRWTPINLIGGFVLFPPYALASLALRGWRVAALAGLAALAAAGLTVVMA